MARKNPLARKMVWDLAVQAKKSHSASLRAMYVAINGWPQKNNVNGQIVIFGRAKTAYLCPVRAAWRIQERMERIQHPLGLLGVSSTGPIAKHDTT